MKYIGIDIGDGESAVTVVSENGSIIPAVVMLGNVKSIRSVVGNLNGKPVIGDQVVLNHAVTARSSRFKSKFLFEEEARNDLRRFASGLYELVKKSLKDNDLKIALGCPAEWMPEARERYAEIVASAGFGKLYTVSESRAAFLYAHYSNELNLSPELLNRPTLVIDIGSSTLDYAYIVDGRERDMGVFGEKRLGGGILDELILKEAVSNSPDKEKIQEIFQNSPSWRSYCELIARKLKETYFLNEEKYAQYPCSDFAPIYADTSNPLSLQISLSGKIMEKLLNQKLPELEDQTFRQALKSSLERASGITSEHPVEVMIVTGGASRMGFFRDLCQETFPNAMLALCSEPEFSIARGLGIAARTDDMLAKFRSKVREFFESGAIELEVVRQMPHLLPEYVPVISKILQKKAVFQAILDFRGDATNADQLETYIQDKIGDVLADQTQTKEADQLINTWIGDRLKRTQEKLNELCDEFKIDRADMSLVKIHTEVKVPAIRVPLILRVLTSFIKAEWRGKVLGFLNGLMTRQMQNRLNAQLTDPNGEFAKVLSEKLVLQLQQQIDEQTKKVEVQIN